MGTVTASKDIGLPSSTRPHGISRQSFLVYLLDLRIRVTVAFLDFVTLGPLILRIRLGIKFLFVRLRFRYPFFSPAPRDTNLGSRFRVRRQLRPGGLSPQTGGMPVILKKADASAPADQKQDHSISCQMEQSCYSFIDPVWPIPFPGKSSIIPPRSVPAHQTLFHSRDKRPERYGSPAHRQVHS